jgi:hypothetical protein
MVNFVLGKEPAISAIVNRRAAVSAKLLGSGHKSMIRFFIPEYRPDAEDDDSGEKMDRGSEGESEEGDDDVGASKRIIEIDNEEVIIQVFDYPSDFLFELESLLDYFLGTSEEILPTAAGYICAILESLFSDDESVVEAFRRLFCKEKYLERLLRNLDLTSVTNLFSHSLLGIKPNRDINGRLSDRTIYYRVYLAHRLSQKLLESDNLEVVDNLTTAMKRLLNARDEILDSGYIIRVVVLGSNFFGDLIKRACKSVV